MDKMWITFKKFQTLARSNLRNKIILLFVLLATLPILILGGVAVYLIDLSHRFDVSNLELQLIDQKIEEIEKFFADTAGILQLQVGFTQKVPIGINEQHFILEGILSENEAFTEASFIDVGGLVVNDTPTHNGIETAKYIRTDGESDKFYDISNLEKFTVPASGKAYVGEVYQTISGPMVTISSPVKNKNGDIIQVLSAEVNLGELKKSIATSALGFSGGLLLIDENGYLISAKNSKAIAGTDLFKFARVKEPLYGKMFDALSDQDRYQSIIDGVPVIGAAKKIPGLGWVLLAEWPVSDADAIIQDVRDQVLTLTLLSILAVLVLAPFFATRIIKPIGQLMFGAAKIEEGNFDEKVSISTKDELEDLGKAFNKMGDGLKRLQELKNEFVFIAAHELRTPVTAIKGYISMILEGDAGPISENIKKFLEPVGIANDRLVQLINDILEIARSEAGRIKIQVFSVNIRAAVKGVIRDILPLTTQKKITIDYIIGHGEPIDLPLVLADTMRLREVITNFVSNAIKYGREGGWVKIYHESDDSYITTHIEDNGMGIPKKEQNRIFEKFFRSETSRITQIQGTGLGLFITKELVEKMGGRVWFESEENKGARFSFKLPRPK